MGKQAGLTEEEQREASVAFLEDLLYKRREQRQQEVPSVSRRESSPPAPVLLTEVRGMMG